MSEAKFEITRLEPGESVCLNTDLCCYQGYCQMAYQHQPDKKQDPYYTYYRISLAHPVAEPASEAKREALEAAGWKSGDAADFLGMDEQERKELDERMEARKAASVPAVDLWQHEREELRKAIEELRAELQIYKDLHRQALRCVDRVFQQEDDGQPPILPDYIKVGQNKFQAVITLAEEFLDLKRANAELSDKLHQAGITIGELQSQLAAAKPAEVQYAWRDARPEDVGKDYKVQVRDLLESKWWPANPDDRSLCPKLVLEGHNGIGGTPWRVSTPGYNNGSSWEFCQVYAPVEAEAAKPAPQEEWRELTKNDQYSGPGQVRSYEHHEWQDAAIAATDGPSMTPFIARVGSDGYYGHYRFARVRKEVGK